MEPFFLVDTFCVVKLYDFCLKTVIKKKTPTHQMIKKEKQKSKRKRCQSELQQFRTINFKNVLISGVNWHLMMTRHYFFLYFFCKLHGTTKQKQLSYRLKREIFLQRLYTNLHFEQNNSCRKYICFEQVALWHNPLPFSQFISLLIVFEMIYFF